MVVISVRSLVPNAKGITYIGRSCSGWKPSVLGNPHHVGGECPTCGKTHEAGETLELYRTWLREEWVKNGEVKAELVRIAKLVKAGETVTLGCWCKRHGWEPCHGDVVDEVVNTLVEKRII